jgi:tRNA modification GTPase
MMVNDEQTIVAQATPKGSGALAIVRLSGSTALEVATAISRLSSQKKLSELPSHTIHFGWVVDDHNNYIDQVLFLIMKAPKSFTGEDVVEISCHNNPFIIEQIIQQAIKKEARLAGPGEFSKRAVLNNKIDLLQAEAINELIHAQTQMGLKQSLSQVEGTLSNWISQLEQALFKALAFSEASFEFIDEEMNFDVQINDSIHAVCATIVSIKKTYNYQQQIRQGIRIALIGSVNAGKSSLFNVLLNQPRAIVTEIPGTTRDIIEAGLYKEGNYWTFVDTAGLRETDNVIEREGIQRSMREAELADIILLIYDGSHPLKLQESTIYEKLITKYNDKIILISNKSDLGKIQSHFSSKSIPISIKTKKNIDQLEQIIATKVAHLFDHIESPFLLNQRQYKLIMMLEQKLIEVQTMLCQPIRYELLSLHLKDALSLICELTGKSISEKGMDQIFQQFCIGK